MKVLVSGFTTFSTHTENSSQIICDLLKETKIPGIELQTVILPVAFSSSFAHLKIEIDSFKPDYIICLGLAGNRKSITLEKVAINQIHTEDPDNEGVTQLDKPISDGPAAYFSTLPLKEMREVNTSFKVEMSFTAGAYVCNYIMFRVLEYVKGTKVKAGFIHLPDLNENQDKILETLISMMSILKVEVPTLKSSIVLIDDDRLIHLNWSTYCKQHDLQFHGFKSIAQFLAFSSGIDKAAHIYIDSNLEGGVKGEVESEKLFNLGYENLYLATSFHKDSIEKPGWIKEIFSKSPENISK